MIYFNVRLSSIWYLFIFTRRILEELRIVNDIVCSILDASTWLSWSYGSANDFI